MSRNTSPKKASSERWSSYQRSLKELGYIVTYLVRTVTNEGGLAPVRKLVLSNDASEEFG